MLAFTLYSQRNVSNNLSTLKNEKKNLLIKNKILRSLVEGERYKNDKLKNRADQVKSYRDDIPIIMKYKTIIQRQKIEILSLAYRQGCIFKRLKDCHDFWDMGVELGISKSTVNFKINLIKLLDKFPKLKSPCWC